MGSSSEGPRVVDRRRIRTSQLGPAAVVSTSTLKPKVTPGAPKVAPKASAPAARTPTISGPPLPFQQSESKSTPLDCDDAWCGLCGGLLYSSPSGIACLKGHGGPSQIGWEAAARLLYDRGALVVDAAELMEAEVADVAAFFHECEKAPPTGAIPDEDRAGILKAFSQGSSIEEVARFFKRVPESVLEALRQEEWDSRAGSSAPPPPEQKEEPVEAPKKEEPAEVEAKEAPVVTAPEAETKEAPPAEPKVEEVTPKKKRSRKAAAAKPPAEPTEEPKKAPEQVEEGQEQPAQLAEEPSETPDLAPRHPRAALWASAGRDPQSAIYEEIGRAYVAAQIAGLTVEEYRKREAETLARLTLAAAALAR